MELFTNMEFVNDILQKKKTGKKRNKKKQEIQIKQNNRETFRNMQTQNETFEVKLKRGMKTEKKLRMNK